MALISPAVQQRFAPGLVVWAGLLLQFAPAIVLVGAVVKVSRPPAARRVGQAGAHP